MRVVALLAFCFSAGIILAGITGLGFDLTPERLIFGGGVFCAVMGAASLGMRRLFAGFVISAALFAAGLAFGLGGLWFFTKFIG